MKHIFQIILLVITSILLLQQVTGSTISGTIYDFSLKKADNVIVTIDTVPPQKFISKDGTYHFTIDFGEYQLQAKRYEDNVLRDSALEKIIIDKEGNYIVDLILVPSFEQEQKLIQELPDNFDPYEEKKTPYKIIFAVVSFIALLAIIYYIKKTEKNIEDEQQVKKNLVKTKKNGKKGKKKKNAKKTIQEPLLVVHQQPPVKDQVQDQDFKEGDKYYQQIMKILKEQQRITQKDIRKEVPLSEAKVSLIITEMETKGIVQKIKKGRGNIVVWKGNGN